MKDKTSDTNKEEKKQKGKEASETFVSIEKSEPDPLNIVKQIIGTQIDFYWEELQTTDKKKEDGVLLVEQDMNELYFRITESLQRQLTFKK